MNLELLTKFASRKLLAMPVGAGILQYLISVGVPPQYAAIFACIITVALIAGQAWVDVSAAKATGQKPDLATVAGAVVQAAGDVAAGKLPDAAEIVALLKQEFESGAIKLPVLHVPTDPKKTEKPS